MGFFEKRGFVPQCKPLNSALEGGAMEIECNLGKEKKVKMIRDPSGQLLVTDTGKADTVELKELKKFLQNNMV